MNPSLPDPLDATVQSMLDDLYWNSTNSAKSIAERFGLPAARISRLVTPLATGVDCWWCARALTWASRSERTNARSLPLVCPTCDARTSVHAIDASLQPSDAVFVLTTGGHRTPRELSNDISDGVDALAVLGLRWSGRFEPVDVCGGPTFVRDTVAAFGAQTIVISSVRALGVSQGDAFGAFRLLLQTDLRIITSRDIIWASRSYQSDSYSHRWAERDAFGDEFSSGRSDGGRSWSDEYRMLGLDDLDDTYDENEEYARRLSW